MWATNELAIARVQCSWALGRFLGRGINGKSLSRPFAAIVWAQVYGSWPGFMDEDEWGSIDVQILSWRALKGRKWLLSVA